MKISLEIQLLCKKLRQAGKSVKEIALEFNISCAAVYKFTSLSGIPKVEEKVCPNCFQQFRSSNKYCSKKCWVIFKNKIQYDNLNIDYFSKIDSAEKAYWLGFLFADGHVFDTPGRSKWIDFALNVKDEDRIDLFIKHIRYGKKYYRMNGNSSQVGVRVGHQKFVTDLIKLGCVARKNKIIQFPNIDKQFELAFILGYIDGDGSLFVSKIATHSLVITSGSLEFLKTIKEKLGIGGAICTDKRSNVCYSLYINVSAYEKIFNSYAFSMKRKRPNKNF